jgi:DNA-binding CsgD family transcriptional regulator
MHLSNDFRKLGVSSRTQLSGALAMNETAFVGSAT